MHKLLAEFIGTFALVFAGTGAIAIGGTIGLEALFAGPISGASMNPARSLAPALVSWTWTDKWLYILGRAIGAVVGVIAYQFVSGEEIAKGATT